MRRQGGPLGGQLARQRACRLRHCRARRQPQSRGRNRQRDRVGAKVGHAERERRDRGGGGRERRGRHQPHETRRAERRGRARPGGAECDDGKREEDVVRDHGLDIYTRRSMSRATELFSRHALLWIIAVGAVLRFSTIGIQDFWLDEVITVQEIQQGPADILRQVNAADSNPMLYPLLAGAWERVFGIGEWGVRALTALFGTLAIPLVYGAATTLASRRAGLIAAGLAATNPLLVWYSGEARNYSLLVLASALVFWCFARALDEVRGQRWLWGWALASGLALTTHYYAAVLVGMTALWLLWRRAGPRLDTVLAIGAIVVVALALSPHVAAR